MRRIPAVLCLLFCVFVISCKKEADFKTKYETTLPNFGNVDLENVFTKEDNQLKNEDSIVNFINQYYQKVWEKGDLSGSVLIAKGNKIIFEKYRGFAQNGEQEPINKNVALHVASVSKTMTAMAVMKLIESGKLKLTDPITKFFPKFPYKEVEVAYLLNQRSGLPKYEHFIEDLKPVPKELSKTFLSNQDVLNLLINYKPELARPVNTGFMYCNTNYALLALIIEKITKTPFPEAMQQIVFRPLKMKDTYIFQENDMNRAAKSFLNRGNKLYPFEKLDLIYGDKNVYTTPRDLLNFSKALFSKDFLRADLMQMVFTPYSNEKSGVNNYGFGFRMKLFDNGEKLTYHNGWWHGSNAVFAHLLKSKVTIIAIGNKYSNKVYSALALSGLFEKFPYETSKLVKEMNPPNDSAKNIKVDSADTSGE